MFFAVHHVFSYVVLQQWLLNMGDLKLETPSRYCEVHSEAVKRHKNTGLDAHHAGKPSLSK